MLPSILLRAAALATVLAAAPAGFAADGPKAAKAETASASTRLAEAPFIELSGGVKMRLTPFGPTQAEFDSLRASLPTHPSVASWLKDTRWRLLSVEAFSPDEGGRVMPATHYTATFYDYTNQRALVAAGSFGDRAAVTVTERKGWQPDPSQEEFDEAVAALLADKTVGAYLASGDVTPYGPMPPVMEFEPGSDRQTPAKRRVVNVGLMPRSGFDAVTNQVIGVDVATQSPLRYAGKAPEGMTVPEASPNCGVNATNQTTTSKGVAGSYTMTVQDGSGNTLWTMVVTRPSASSGTRGSAIEVANVQYKGRSVMKRGHVPILNILYAANNCGPYRDWQYQEGQFATDGTGATPASNENVPNGSGGFIAGFRACAAPATTALENGTDAGNFKGVAVYRQGTETVMVTEMEAGWYRYINEWRFDDNGTIRPRFGFGATINGCTCSLHYHHVYFRLDMDVDGTTNRIYEVPVDTRLTSLDTRNNQPIATEKKVFRDPSKPVFYRILGAGGGGRGYQIYAGPNDGDTTNPTDPAGYLSGVSSSGGAGPTPPNNRFARGDLWFLKYKSGSTPVANEFDDGISVVTGNSSTNPWRNPNGVEAQIDTYLNGESLIDQDIVVWYHATVTHSPTAASFMCLPNGYGVPGRDILTGDKVVGPDLVPEGF